MVSAGRRSQLLSVNGKRVKRKTAEVAPGPTTLEFETSGLKKAGFMNYSPVCSFALEPKSGDVYEYSIDLQESDVEPIPGHSRANRWIEYRAVARLKENTSLSETVPRSCRPDCLVRVRGGRKAGFMTCQRYRALRTVVDSCKARNVHDLPECATLGTELVMPLIFEKGVSILYAPGADGDWSDEAKQKTRSICGQSRNAAQINECLVRRGWIPIR